MKKHSLYLFLLLAIFGGVLSGARFGDKPVVHALNDRQASPVPRAQKFDFRRYAISSSVRYPLRNGLKFKSVVRSQDVNALDQLVESAWYQPRMTSGMGSAREWIQGLQKKGPPQGPYKVLMVKSEGSAPGFIVKDARGEKYLLKFDNPGNMGLESATNFVVNRLFWALGYNVPEDYAISLSRSELSAEEATGINAEKIDETFLIAGAPLRNANRLIASLFLEGKILGYASQQGRRKDDLNDKIDHENLRALRALNVFSAWLHMTSFRSDNWLDVYEGQEGSGYVRHYLLDFSEAFGLHAFNYSNNWEGHEHLFSWGDSVAAIAKLGIPVREFEKTSANVMAPLDFFSADLFEPAEWKPYFPYIPFEHAIRDDNYWAAKQIARVKQSDLETLFQASGHENQEEARFLIEQLMLRGEKLIRHCFSAVTPVEGSLVGGDLKLEDQWARHSSVQQSSHYAIAYRDAAGESIASAHTVQSDAASFTIPLPDSLLQQANGYLVIEVRKQEVNQVPAPPATFHISKKSGTLQLIGVLH